MSQVKAHEPLYVCDNCPWACIVSFTLMPFCHVLALQEEMEARIDTLVKGNSPTAGKRSPNAPQRAISLPNNPKAQDITRGKLLGEVVCVQDQCMHHDINMYHMCLHAYVLYVCMYVCALRHLYSTLTPSHLTCTHFCAQAVVVVGTLCTSGWTVLGSWWQCTSGHSTVDQPRRTKPRPGWSPPDGQNR